MRVNEIDEQTIVPSAINVDTSTIAGWTSDIEFNRLFKPQIGDVVYGEILELNQHTELENTEGRIHQIRVGTKALFVYGNRYATGYYEGRVPRGLSPSVDLLSRSGVIGAYVNKSASVGVPTQVTILGVCVDKDGNTYNTTKYPLMGAGTDTALSTIDTESKTIVFVGTSMDSGKSTSASMCIWGLRQMGFSVNGSKITGTASLKDVLHMQDAGAKIVNDFTWLGYPSTYMLDKADVLDVYTKLRQECTQQGTQYWVIEIADGILQRETQMLLQDKSFRHNISSLVFCSADSLGVLSGLSILKDKFNLVPDALSGIFASSPLMQQEVLDNIPNSLKGIKIYDNKSSSVSQLKKVFVDSPNSVIKETLDNLHKHNT